MFSNAAGLESSLFIELLLNKRVKLLETHGHPQLQSPPRVLVGNSFLTTEFTFGQKNPIQTGVVFQLGFNKCLLGAL